MHACLLIAPLLLAACTSGGRATADELGPRATRDYGLNGFERIELKGSDDVVVHVGPTFAVRAEAPQGVLDRLELTVEGRALKVGRRDDDWNWGGSESAAKLTVTLPRLTGAIVAGSGTMQVDRTAGESFSGAVTGSGDLDIAALEAATAKLSVAGSGNIEANGRIGRGDYSIAGSGDLDAKDVEADSLTVSVAGSGDVGATARTNAAISIVGSGNVVVSGGGKCTVNKVGSGDVECG